MFGIDKNMPQMVIIEGLIGAGKSTLVDKIKREHPYVRVFKEPLDNPIINKMLPEFYNYLSGKSTNRSICFQFQFAWLTIRAKMHEEACKLIWNKGITCIFDRSIYGDSAFIHNLHVAGHVNETEYEIYNSMRDFLSKRLYVPHNFVWLDVSIDEVMNRIAKRDRACERGITKEYLEGLYKSYVETVLEPFEKIGSITYYEN